MNNEFKLATELNSEITINNRRRIEISGVIKLESLNSQNFLLKTNKGTLYITGNNLEMEHLDKEKGILYINGVFDSLAYINDKQKEKNKEGFISRLFK